VAWLRALYRAILAFFASRKADEAAAHQEAQDAQDAIVEETQEAIDEIPDESDADLTDIAVDTGLVRRDTDPSPDPGRPGGLGTGNSEYSGRKPGSSFKTGY
jgi:hypothetical protein